MQTAKTSNTFRQLAHLLPFINGLKNRYALGGLLLLITNIAALLTPWLMKKAVEQLENPINGQPGASQYALLIAALAFIHCLVRIFSRTTILNAARQVEYKIREALFANLMELDQTFFHKERTGDLISRFANDLTNIRMLCGFGSMSMLNTLILYFAAVWLMLMISPLLTLAALLPLPLMVIIVQAVSGRIFTLSIQAQEELAKVSNQVEEAFSGAMLIKSYGMEAGFSQQFQTVTNSCLHKNLALARLRSYITPVIALTTGSGTLAILYLGGKLVISQTITLGDFIAFSGYLALLVWPTMVLGWTLTLFQRGAASAARINELLSATPLVNQAENPQNINGLQKSIEFRNLAFSYGNTQILHNISLVIAAGERIGITGPVGSGKSTLLQLIPRLLPLDNGMILLDGQDINQMNLHGLRRFIGYLPQEATLFSRTIADNIAYGGTGDPVKAAKTAGLAADLAGFTDGLDTLVGEQGVTLSGGQRRRVALARALAGNPQLLLLDDPLAAVDADQESKILDTLAKAWSGKTVLLASHRISAFRDCHKIMVLNEGCIAEFGAKAELLQRNGLYAELARKQGGAV